MSPFGYSFVSTGNAYNDFDRKMEIQLSWKTLNNDSLSWELEALKHDLCRTVPASLWYLKQCLYYACLSDMYAYYQGLCFFLDKSGMFYSS